MQEMRVVAAPAFGVGKKAVTAAVVPRVIFVPAAQDAEAPVVAGVEFGVPLPITAIPIPAG
jgi:hypothetical protein